MTTETTRPARLHHHAYVTTDQEATRSFYEEVVGLPLVATWTEIGDGQEYCHTMFGLADGGALAFFQFADQQFSKASAPPVPFSPYRHLALGGWCFLWVWVLAIWRLVLDNRGMVVSMVVWS